MGSITGLHITRHRKEKKSIVYSVVHQTVQQYNNLWHGTEEKEYLYKINKQIKPVRFPDSFFFFCMCVCRRTHTYMKTVTTDMVKSCESHFSSYFFSKTKRLTITQFFLATSPFITLYKTQRKTQFCICNFFPGCWRVMWNEGSELFQAAAVYFV